MSLLPQVPTRRGGGDGKVLMVTVVVVLAVENDKKVREKLPKQNSTVDI